MDRITGDTIDLGDGKRGFRGRNMSAGLKGTVVAATWLNDLQEELISLIEALGLTPTQGERGQVREALRQILQEQAWTYAVATGTANAVIANLAVAPPALTDGLSFDVRMTKANSGAVMLTVNTLAPQPVLHAGAALAGGEWASGDIVSFRYSAALGGYLMTGARSESGSTTPVASYGSLRYAINTGTADAVVCTTSSPFTGFSTGMTFLLYSATPNTGGAMSVAVDGLGATPLLYAGGDPPAGTFGVGKIRLVQWASGNFHVVSPYVPDTYTTTDEMIVTTTTWAVPNCDYVKVVLHGAGGAGGGATTTTGKQIAQGGGAGEWVEQVFARSELPSEVTITLPAGGAGVVGASGGDGQGDATFGSLLRAKPGRGGAINGSSTSNSGRGGTGGTGALRGSGNPGQTPGLYGSGAGGAGLIGGAGMAGDAQTSRKQGLDGEWGSGGGGSENGNLAGGAGGHAWCRITTW